MSGERFEFTSRVRPVVEIGLGDTRGRVGTAVWDQAQWDTDVYRWGGTEPDWLDITCDVHEMHWSIGRASNCDRFQPSSAEFTIDNRTGQYDGTVNTGVIGDALVKMRPGRRIRAGVVHETLGRVWLWHGYVDATRPGWEPGRHDIVQMSAICALGEAGRTYLERRDNPVGAGELAHERVNRILTAIPWPLSWRDISLTGVTLTGTEFGRQVADELAMVAESCGGSVWGGPDGHIHFRGRDWQTYTEGTPADATIGNVEAGDVCPSGWVLSSDRNDITTRAIMERPGTTPVVLESPKGVGLYGVETWEATDLFTDDRNDREMLADRILRIRGWRSTPRVESCELDAATSDGALDLMTTADPFRPSRYRCRLRLPRGSVFDRQSFVTGVEHHMSRSQWRATLRLDTSRPFGIPENVARWDSSNWDQHEWAVAP